MFPVIILPVIVNPLKLTFKKDMQLSENRIGNVVGRNVVSFTVVCGFDQATDNKICISRFSAKQAALRRKSKYRLGRNQDNMSA